STMNASDRFAFVPMAESCMELETAAGVQATPLSARVISFQWTFTRDEELYKFCYQTNGVWSNAHWKLQEPVMLSHSLPWVVEWKCSGNWSGMLLSSDKASATKDMRFLFRTTTDTGFMGFGEYVNSNYHNYGIALNALGIAPAAEHIFRVENRIASDGSNMAYLFVDGTEIGPMNNYYIGGSNNQNKTVNWLNGRDFLFHYIGSSGHAMNNIAIDYIEVWEEGITAQSLSLCYDDRYDVTGKTVEIVNAGTPTSYVVGYGVAENSVKDTAVVTLKGDTLVATGIGTAMVKIDGVLHEINVTAAPISLLLLAGQSNMQGIDGDAAQSITCPDGQVYATYADRWYRTVKDYRFCAPSALTGEYRTVNAAGTAEELSDFPVYMLTEEGSGREGMDSGIAYEWNRQTGDKVWVVNMGYGGSSINAWQKGGTHYNATMTVFGCVTDTLRKEIAAGHFTLNHMGYFWCQGCADETQTAQWYTDKYLSMHESFLSEMAFDHDSDPNTPKAAFEFGGIIPIRAGHEGAGSYRAGTYTQTTSASYYQSFKDLRMNGPRVAQYYMGNDPALKDIWNVCTIQEKWATMPDGSDGVAAYFNSAYPNGTVDYVPQVAQSAAWYKPTTPKAVHDNIHYNQIGYNEIGRESARNALINLGVMEAPDAPVTVEFVTWDGFTPAEKVTASTAPNSGTLVVPMVSPVYRSKDVTYTLSDGLVYDYYDLTAQSGSLSGTLGSSVGARSVSVEPKTLAVFAWEFNGTDLAPVSGDGFTENKLTRGGGSVTNEQFNNLQYRAAETMLLCHDRPWRVEWTVKNWNTDQGSMILSGGGSSTSGLPYLYQRSADYFVGFGYYDGKQYHNYGLALNKLGFNGEDGKPHSFRLENRVADGGNEICLTVDGKEYGALTEYYVNSALQTEGTDWLKGRNFSFSSLGCGDFPLRGWIMESLTVNEIGGVSLPLRYDDRYDVTGKTVEIVNGGTPTSYVVGYGVAENSVKDTAVVTLKGDTLVATGIGTATVKIDGVLHEINVTAAPISLLLLAGQSNMQGSEGDANQSIVCPDGMVYSTYGDRYTMTINNATNFAPGTLTGAGSAVNVNGTTTNLKDWPVYLLNEAGAGKIGPDSGFAYEWVKQTGEKVWVVNAAHGGTSINVWQPGTKEYEECRALFTACTETLRKEIAAGHFTLSHMAYFWCQGCSDSSQTAQWYVNKYLTMHESFKTELAFDHDSNPNTADKTFELGGIIPILYGVNSYRVGVNSDKNTKPYYESFEQLYMNGPRVAQYWMGGNPELEDIHLVCNIGEDWVWMPDGTNGVADYFNKHYTNGTVDYTTQVKQADSWYKPTTPKAVHDSIHYNQIGYNEVGRESVRNALILLGEKADYTEQT
ncbi:MAG: hypothetical protein IIV43_07610, partial [Oscillospiraceae bacterium]|nr:hypothetical protein [Oscillospiraceae bacterium]